LRVLLCLIISKIFKTKKYVTLALSGIITLFIVPCSGMELGFQLSYLCTSIVIMIFNMKLNNFILEQLLINILILIICLPIMSQIDETFNITSIILTIPLTYIFAFSYMMVLFDFWIIWIPVINDALTNIIYMIVNLILNFNIPVTLFKFNNIITTCYFGTMLFFCCSRNIN
jgi:hypothetical protein